MHDDIDSSSGIAFPGGHGIDTCYCSYQVIIKVLEEIIVCRR